MLAKKRKHPTVFISYSHQDKGFARFVAQQLRDEGARVWVDEGELQVGQSLLATIGKAVNRVKFVLAIISKHSIRSRWVGKELAIAMQKELGGRTVVVIPLRIDDCRMPDFISDKLYCDLSPSSHDWETQFSMLFRAVGLTGRRSGARPKRHMPLSLSIPAVLENLKISEKDCGTNDGFYPQAYWTGHLAIPYHHVALGRVLTDKTKTTKGAVWPRGTILTDSVIESTSYILDTPRMKVRWLPGCETFFRKERAFCAMCYGAAEGTDTLVRVGQDVGAAAAEAILEALSHVHDTSILETILEAGPKSAAILSPWDATVKIQIRANGEREIALINGLGGTRCVPISRLSPCVRDGERVLAGQPLTGGDIGPKQLLDVLGEKSLQHYLFFQLSTEFLRHGFRIPARYIEVIVVRMTSFLEVGDLGYEPVPFVRQLVGKILPVRDFIAIGQHQAMNGERPPIGQPVVLGLTEIVQLEKQLIDFYGPLKEFLATSPSV